MASGTAKRFRARIYKQGPNPYVDVPQRVTRAFASHARAGRISVEGTLNGTPILATLVPMGKGGHRLYVNGGMRSATGVAVGDTVSFQLRAISRDAVPLPPDVVEALRSANGAEAALGALTPSHRRELLHYINDARTPRTRRRRIETTIQHALGKGVPAGRKGRDRPLWTCPRCGNEFVNKNQYHSCKRYTLNELFAARPPHIRGLFDRLRGMVEACGPVKVLPHRDMVGFMVRVRFAGAVPRTRWMDVALWLPRRVEDPRFHKIETVSPDVNVHLLRITDPEQLDDQVAAWIEDAYAMGRQEPPT